MEGVDASQVVDSPPGLRLKFRNFNPRELPMTTHDANSMAAAELADRYIEIVLSTKPELLVSTFLAEATFHEIPAYAQRVAQFRQQLINELMNQPLPGFEEN